MDGTAPKPTPENISSQNDTFAASDPAATLGLDSAACASETVPGPPKSIGPYRLVRVLGEGGMGQVWLAEQTAPVQRMVALKLIRVGAYDPGILLRFESERQSLAIMEHPAIAKVFDAGATPDGQPYFVMEYVAGIPIVQYCDAKRLGIRERVELFIQVCEGVQHAHQKAIMHRDLKPANILVSEVDGKPVPRIIDFGLAKAVTPSDTVDTMLTRAGAYVGTPGYMSPEQASGAQDVDTRTDVYSLGVVLYELLTGSLPLGVPDHRRPIDEIFRELREVDPPRPSTRVRNSGKTFSSEQAQMRGTEARQLEAQLTGDLDWITLKAIEKDRDRRYETANGLAMDVRRFLGGEPVLAAPPSASYRLLKFVRRHRVAVATAVVVAVTLVAGIVGTTLGMLRAERQRKAAEKVASFMKDILKGSGPQIARGRDTALLKEIVRQASERIEKGDLKDAPEAEVELRSSIGSAETDLAELATADRMLAPAVGQARAVFGPKSLQAAQALEDLSWLRFQQARYAESEAMARECLEIRRKLLPPKSREVADAAGNLGVMLIPMGRAKEGEPLLREAVAIMKEVPTSDGETLVTALSNLAYCIRRQDRYSDAEAVYREALDASRRLLPDSHPYTGSVLHNLGIVLMHEKRLPEAEEAYKESLDINRRVLGNEHPTLAATLTGLATIAQAQGKLTDAEGQLREALAIVKKALGPNHPNVMSVTSKLVELLAQEGKLAEAEKLGHELLAFYETSGNMKQAAALKQRLDSHFAHAVPATK